jgi:hypothetical protein
MSEIFEQADKQVSSCEDGYDKNCPPEHTVVIILPDELIQLADQMLVT